MGIQVIGMAVFLVMMLQLVFFITSSSGSMKQAYADSWRKTGTVIAHAFQTQRGSDRWIGFFAFGLVVYAVAIAAALDVCALFIH